MKNIRVFSTVDEVYTFCTAKNYRILEFGYFPISPKRSFRVSKNALSEVLFRPIVIL